MIFFFSREEEEAKEDGLDKVTRGKNKVAEVRIDNHYFFFKS